MQVDNAAVLCFFTHLSRKTCCLMMGRHCVSQMIIPIHEPALFIKSKMIKPASRCQKPYYVLEKLVHFHRFAPNYFQISTRNAHVSDFFSGIKLNNRHTRLLGLETGQCLEHGIKLVDCKYPGIFSDARVFLTF